MKTMTLIHSMRGPVFGAVFGAVFATVLLPLAANAASPTLTPLEEGIEAYSVELLVNKRGKGTAVVRACRDCKPQKLRVTSATKVYAKGQEVPLASGTHAGDVMVFYIIEDETVSRIYY